MQKVFAPASLQFRAALSVHNSCNIFCLEAGYKSFVRSSAEANTHTPTQLVAHCTPQETALHRLHRNPSTGTHFRLCVTSPLFFSFYLLVVKRAPYSSSAAELTASLRAADAEPPRQSPALVFSLPLIPVVGGLIQVEMVLVRSLGEHLQQLLPNSGQLQTLQDSLLMGSKGHCPGIPRRGVMRTAQLARMLKEEALPHHQRFR